MQLSEWFVAFIILLYPVSCWGSFILGAKSVNQEAFKKDHQVDVYNEIEKEDDYGTEDPVQI